ncbi:MAG TPA: hemolysin III family protein [Mycobacteriales bacterium]|nr:hemolysin III family protein [Mycobacteriales bacterium]
MSAVGPGLPLPVRALLQPRLRGKFHVWASLVSIAAGAVLVAVAAATRGARPGAATAVYALTVSLLFGTSALYHRLNWSPGRLAVMARLDHSMIFVFIAGTYTPFAVLSLPSRTGQAVLLVVWIGAVAGLVLRSAWPSAPRWLSVPLYLALGWVAVFVLPELLRHGGVAAFVLLITGGLLYTFGAVVYGLKRPDPAPNVFGFHEVFHLCTVLAAVCHYIAVWLIIY